jgi:aspartate/methionine/tyrosine aminotransferase
MRLNLWTIRAADSPIGLAHDALDLRAGAHELLDLAQAAPQYPPAPEVVERIVATAQHPHGGEYTEIAGLPRPREAFASELSATYSGQVRPEHVIIIAGCNQAFCISDAGMRLP